MKIKTITLISFSVLLLSACAVKKGPKRNVEFTITDGVVNDNSFINLLISNKTPSNYYLPIITSPENEKWKFILSSDENLFFFIHVLGYNSDHKEMDWTSTLSDHGDWTEIEKYTELWRQKEKDISVNDLILLKSGESVKIKVPIHLTLKISDNMIWELKNYKSEKNVQLAIYYSDKRSRIASKLLNTNIKKELKKMKYKLYRSEINSNKVSLVLN